MSLIGYRVRVREGGQGVAEAVGLEERVVVEEVGQTAVGGEVAAGEDEGAAAERGGDLEVVCGDEHGFGPALQQLDDALSGAGVEAGGGFVEDEDRWFGDEDGSEGGQASFAAGEVVCGAICGVVEAEVIECLTGPALGVGGRVSVVEGAEGDVFEEGRQEELVVGVLEHEADPAADVPGGVVLDGGPVDVDAAGLGEEEPVEVEEEGALPRAVGAEERHALAWLDREGQVAQDGLPTGVGEAEVFDAQAAHRRAEAVMAPTAAASAVSSSAGRPT